MKFPDYFKSIEWYKKHRKVFKPKIRCYRSVKFNVLNLKEEDILKIDITTLKKKQFQHLVGYTSFKYPLIFEQFITNVLEIKPSQCRSKSLIRHLRRFKRRVAKIRLQLASLVETTQCDGLCYLCCPQCKKENKIQEKINTLSGWLKVCFVPDPVRKKQLK